MTVHEIRGYAWVLLATVCFGTGGIFARMIYHYESDPLTVVTFRAGGATCLLLLGLLVFRRDLLKINVRDIPFFAMYGFLSVTCNYLSYFYAIKHITIAMAVTLLYTYPALVVIFSALFLQEPLTKNKLISFFLTFLGVLLVVQIYHPAVFQVNIKGILFGLGTSLSVALYTILGKKAIAKYDSWTVVFYAIGFGTIFLILLRTPRVLLSVSYPLEAWGWIFLVALVPTVLSYASYTRSFHYLEASRASIVASFEVVIASFLAFLFLGESLGIPQIAGTGFVIWGIARLQKRTAPIAANT